MHSLLFMALLFAEKEKQKELIKELNIVKEGAQDFKKEFIAMINLLASHVSSDWRELKKVLMYND